MSVRRSVSASSASIVWAGSAAKASSVGANTVNGPSPPRKSVSPAAPSAARSVPKPPASCAVWMMSKTTSGKRTSSITWMTPFVASMSVAITVASSIMTVPPSAVMVTSAPLTVVAEESPTTSEARTRPGTT